MENKTAAKPAKGWAFLTPKGKMDHINTSKRWGWIHMGIVTGWGARKEEFWNERGYRCIRVTITPDV